MISRKLAILVIESLQLKRTLQNFQQRKVFIKTSA